MTRRLGIVLAVGCVLAALTPARADLKFASTEILRPILSRMLGDPPSIYIEVIPDIYEGGYARVSVYARNVMIKGMRIDEIWIKLVGASFDPDLLPQGRIKVLDVRGSAVYGKINLMNVQDFLSHQGPVQDIRLFMNDEGAVVGVATIVYNGIPTHVRMQGVFQASGAPEVFFHIQNLIVNSLPVPYIIVDHLERELNPVVDFRTWPVEFKIRSIRQTPEGFVLSSQADYSQPCNDCGGPQLQLTP